MSAGKRRRKRAPPPIATRMEQLPVYPDFTVPEPDYVNIFQWGGRLRQYLLRDLVTYPHVGESWLVCYRLEELLANDESLQAALAAAHKAGYTERSKKRVQEHIQRVFDEQYLVECIQRFTALLPKITNYILAKEAWYRVYPEHFSDGDADPPLDGSSPQTDIIAVDRATAPRRRRRRSIAAPANTQTPPNEGISNGTERG